MQPADKNVQESSTLKGWLNEHILFSVCRRLIFLARSCLRHTVGATRVHCNCEPAQRSLTQLHSRIVVIASTMHTTTLFMHMRNCIIFRHSHRSLRHTSPEQWGSRHRCPGRREVVGAVGIRSVCQHHSVGRQGSRTALGRAWPRLAACQCQ